MADDTIWITETLYEKLGVRIAYRADQIVFDDHSGHHHLAMIENGRFGKTLFLDGATQITSADAFYYNEMMAHVPLFAHGRAARVLIVGGGDCGIASRVLKHPEVESLVMVEIDQGVVDLARDHYPEFAGPVLADERFRLVIDKGEGFIASTDETFDVVIVDSPDPVGPAEALFTTDFYGTCKARLAPRGVMVTQSGVPFLQMDELVTGQRRLRAHFADVACYVVPVPTYFGGHMALGWASDDGALRRASSREIAARHAAAGGFATSYWTPEVHCAAFALPAFIRDAIA